MAAFNGEIVMAEEDKVFTMQDENGKKVEFALLGWAQAEENVTYLIMRILDGSMDEGEALVFLQTQEGMELVTDMELVEGIFNAYNQLLEEPEAE